jgi:LacI family transcriptional regulator
VKSAVARRKAFLHCLAEIGLQADPELVRESDHTIEGGMRELDPLLKLSQPPTAILCHNDLTAIGVMHRAREHGVEIPRQLSVGGFDDIPLARFVFPPLTTVRMSQPELARLAFHALMTDVLREAPAPHGSEYVLETKLVLRKSTALAPGGARTHAAD